MPDFNAWGGDTVPLSDWTGDLDRAHDTAREIAEKPASITILRAGGNLAAQTVRLEPTGGAGERQGANALVSRAGVIVLGYYGHPTITDTNIRRGDRFFAGGQEYSVTQVLPDIPDRLIAIAEASE
jgi:hypothetical protein